MNWPNIAEHWPQILGGLAVVVAVSVIVWRVHRALPKDITPDEARELHYPKR